MWPQVRMSLSREGVSGLCRCMGNPKPWDEGLPGNPGGVDSGRWGRWGRGSWRLESLGRGTATAWLECWVRVAGLVFGTVFSAGGKGWKYAQASFLWPLWGKRWIAVVRTQMGLGSSPGFVAFNACDLGLLL